MNERMPKWGEWQPASTAPKDGTWILGLNNRGNPAVIIWSERAHDRGRFAPGWIHPFSEGDLSAFWNGGCGSVLVAWMPFDPDHRAAAAVGDVPKSAPLASGKERP